MAPKLPTGSFAQLPVGGKILLLVMLLALLTSGYYVVLHMSLKEETQSAESRHGTLERQLKEAHDRQKEYLRLREEVAAREALDRQNLRILPVNAEIPAFLDDLNRLAELSGLQMNQVTPAAEATEPFYIKVPVNLSMHGRYHELAKFFYNISRLERAINMEDVKLVVASKTGDEIRLGVDVRATTFRRNKE